MLELREARYFHAVAEELHFGRAAQRLHMSQPPLSQVIKSLEQRLGAQLLTRTTRAVALTAAGEVLLQHCRRLINLAEEAEAATRDAATGQLGHLRIGAVTSAFFDPLPGMLSLFRQRHPRVEVVLQEVDTHHAVRALTDHAIDVAIVRLLATPPGIARRTLLEEAFVLAVPATWDHIPAGTVDLSTVARQPWVWLPRHISPDYHDQVVTCCREAGFAPVVTNTADSIVSQLAMVACDIGVAVVPASSADHALNLQGRVRFVEFRSTATIQLAALWLEQTASPAVAEFARQAPQNVSEFK
jgi:DNA-binding transcriptional LysR family regulator